MAPAGTRNAGGRPPKLLSWQRQAIVDAVLSGQRTAAEMARRYRVSDATVSRLLAGHRAGTDATPSAAGSTAVSACGLVAGALPPAALDERLAVVGISGSGKTYATKGLVEQVVAGGGRVCVLDPLGVWWGLREAADGGPPPFPVVVFGGDHADVPLRPDAAPVLGRLVAGRRLACVVDVSGFGTAAERRDFVTRFLDALYEANRAPLHLVLDEADLWAPQRAQPDGGALLGRVEEIVRRGRVRGFVPWLISQRPAVLHKDVLSQADVLVSMKLTSSQDRAALGAWLEGQADRRAGQGILAGLPRLHRGEGWVWAPGHGVLAPARFPRILTRDTSAAPGRPQRAAGEAGVPLPLPDLHELRAVLAGGSDGAAGSEVDVGEDWRPPPALAPEVRHLEAELAAARQRQGELERELAALKAVSGA